MPQDAKPRAEGLIVNADDLGKDEFTTSSILKCHLGGRISSASGMVFMRDSEKAADMALQAGLDVGLHLNLTQALTGLRNKPLLESFHGAIAGFLTRMKRWPPYHPLLRRQFEYVFHAQWEEFQRLYGEQPSHVDGHQHMHLCANMVIDRVIPRICAVRRSFHFFNGEKSAANRLYRRFLNQWVSRNFISTDYFFDIEPMVDDRLLRIVALSRISTVELMVHPERMPHLDYLLSDRFHAFLKRARAGTWKDVATRAEAETPGMDLQASRV
jgi:predicted glycoside hydrolase/deacetylase ChbG (UPF0249 family)